MEIAWSLRDEKLETASRKLVLQCQVGWIESHIKPATELPRDNSPGATLPVIAEAIDSVKRSEELKNHQELESRFRRAELFYSLLSGKFGITQEIIVEIESIPCGGRSLFYSVTSFVAGGTDR